MDSEGSGTRDSLPETSRSVQERLEIHSARARTGPPWRRVGAALAATWPRRLEEHNFFPEKTRGAGLRI